MTGRQFEYKIRDYGDVPIDEHYTFRRKPLSVADCRTGAAVRFRSFDEALDFVTDDGQRVRDIIETWELSCKVNTLHPLVAVRFLDIWETGSTPLITEGKCLSHFILCFPVQTTSGSDVSPFALYSCEYFLCSTLSFFPCQSKERSYLKSQSQINSGIIHGNIQGKRLSIRNWIDIVHWRQPPAFFCQQKPMVTQMIICVGNSHAENYSFP